MKIKLTFIVVLFLLANLAQAQVKFYVEKLNADSLAALLTEKEGSEKADVLNLLSNVICRNDIDSSISLATEAIQISEHLDYKKGLADAYYNLGNASFLLDNLEPTIANYLKACRFYEDLDPCIEYGYCCLQIALLNYFTRGPEESPPYFDKAVKTICNIGDKTDKYNINFTLAVTNNVVYPPEPDSVIYYGFKAISYLDTAVNHNELSYVYCEIGEAYSPLYTRPSDTSYLTIALSWFIKALKLQGITDDMKITLLLNIASTYLGYNTDEHTSEAMVYLDKAMKIPDTCIGVFDQKPAIFQMLGAINYKKGEYEKAISLYNKGIQMAEARLADFIINEYPEPIHGYNNRYYINYDRQLMYEGIYHAYSKLGKNDKALENYILYKQAADGVFLEQNQNLITMLEAVSIDEKNKGQIELLASENELQKMKVRQSRTLMIVLVGCAFFFILIAIIIIRQRKIRSEQKLLHDLELKKVESDKLKELDQLKSSFFANISHEFRTPLTLILSPAEKLLSKITDESHRNELLLIHRYARRLRRLINQLLNLSKLEAGKLKLNAREENIVKLLKTFTQSFESLAKQRNVQLDFKSEKGEIIVSVDQNKLEIIINNLLSNAFKFTPEGGQISVEVANMPDDDNAAGEVHIIVSDSGLGIPEDKLGKIFERFYLVDETNANPNYHEGSGIGLALAKELIELHHGEIRVESKMNVGTIFRIILPVSGANISAEENNGFEDTPDGDGMDEFSQEIPLSDIYPQEPEKIPDKKQPVIDSSKPVLLVVEDNPDLRAHVCYHLSGEYNIIEAKDGEEGLGETIRAIPDLIISDVMMPKMDGFEMSNAIKNDERTCHIPIILLTALAARESRIEGFETGADDFISKPFDMEELQIRVKNLIAQRHRVSQFIERKIKTLHANLYMDFADSGITSMDEQFMQKLVALLKEHHTNPELNITEFSQLFGQSVAQLNRKIKALTGQSTAEFIRTYRLNRAAELIKKKSATVAEIAYDVGFNNPSYFTECFKQYFGTLPSEFNDHS